MDGIWRVTGGTGGMTTRLSSELKNLVFYPKGNKEFSYFIMCFISKLTGFIL